MPLKHLRIPRAVAVRVAGDGFVAEDVLEQNSDVVHALGARGEGYAGTLTLFG